MSSRAFSLNDVTAAILYEPLVVARDAPLLVAISRMSQARAVCPLDHLSTGNRSDTSASEKASCVLVVDVDDRVVGILTERDIVRLGVRSQPLHELTVQQVMVSPVITLKQSSLQEVFTTANLLQQYKIRHLPILDDEEKLIGLITHKSLRRVMHPADLLRLRLAEEVMATHVVCAGAKASLLEIAEQLVNCRVSSVVIVETPTAAPPVSQASTIAGLPSGKSRDRSLNPASTTADATDPNQVPQRPIGIVTEHDLLQVQAMELSLGDYTASQVMSTPIFSVRPKASLWTVHQLMEQHFIHRVIVVGDQGELLGIVTQSSLLQALNPLELYKLTEILEAKVERLETEKMSLLQARASELEHKVHNYTADLKAKVKREKLLKEIALQIHSSFDVTSVLNIAVDQVRRVIDCERAYIWQFTPNSQSMMVAESTRTSVSLLGQAMADQWVETYLIAPSRTGRLQVVADVNQGEITDDYRAFLRRLQAQAIVLVPLISHGRPWGGLGVCESHCARNWLADEIELLKALAVQLGIAIQQATGYQQVQASHQRYVSLAAAVPVGIFQTDTEGHCCYVNERWREITGLSTAIAMGSGWEQSLHPADRTKVINEWYRCAQQQQPFSLEFRWQNPSGQTVWVYGQALPERDEKGDITGYVGTITDITERKQIEVERNQLFDQLKALNDQLEAKVARRTLALQQAVDQLQSEVNRREILEESLRDINQQLEAQSQVDGLTQIANRRHFDQQLYREWYAARRQQTPLSLLLLDVDFFKQYNDCYGHQQGDRCLQQLAQTAHQSISRSEDLVARYGGEEFVLLLPNTDIEGAVNVAQRLQAAIAALGIPHAQSRISAHVTVSIGIATWMAFISADAADGQPISCEVLLSMADKALYNAKAQGRDRYTVFQSWDPDPEVGIAQAR